MILQSLYDYYQRLSADPSVPIARPGYSLAKVDFAFVLSTLGELKHVLPLYDMDGSLRRSREVVVPEQTKRTMGISANLFCDKAEYILGWSADRPDRAQKARKAFKLLHQSLLSGNDDEGAVALVKFLDQSGFDANHPLLAAYREQLLAGGNIIFMLQNETCFLHDRPAIKQVIENRQMEDAPTIQCLVTGETGALARLHPSIKGVVGAQSSGASIVSFNKASFESYGKSQGLNAPVMQHAAFAYATALNYLISDRSHKMLLGDTTTVFWTDRRAMQEERIVATLFGFDEDRFAKTEDPDRLQVIHSVIDHVRSGRRLSENLQIDDSVGFHILGLAPNASRLSIRFYYQNSFASLTERLCKHYEDAEITRSSEYRPQYPSIWHMLKEIAARKDIANIPNTMIANMINTLLIGSSYPLSLFTGVLMRIRADHEVNATRAAILKAVLVRKHRLSGYSKEKEMIHVGLNLENKSPGYLLGRVFAVLEKAQGEAIGSSTNSTIRDRFMGSAAATPSAVFPQLLRLANHHVRKLDGGGARYDRMIQLILNDMSGDSGFPKTMNNEEQGLFYIGYYQQRQELYTKQADVTKATADSDNNVIEKG